MSAPFDGRRYQNLSAPTARSLWKVIWWLAFTRRQKWPAWVDDVPPSAPPPAAGPGQLAVTFVNHSTFLLQHGGVSLLTDPVWSERASPLTWAGPRRVRRPGLDLDQLPPVHVVLVSHNHYDHMDLATLRRLDQGHRPLFVTGRGNRRKLERSGLDRVVELDWWQALDAVPGVGITMTPAQHFSRRGIFDVNRSLWGGFFLNFGGADIPACRDDAQGRQECPPQPLTVYFTGDSGYGAHFREIRDRLGPPDVALLPIGAYEPRWFMRVNHINPEEAVQAHLDLGARRSFAMHFGTFQLTDEPIDEPKQRLRAALRRKGLDERAFAVPGFGETCLLEAGEPAA
jgi:L-ascorbate metabolism protein UlaG (beta-lactamase superfamily)